MVRNVQDIQQRTRNMRRGQALLVAVLFLMLSSTAALSVSVLPFVKNFRVVQEATRSRESYFVSEALAEDIVYRYKAALDVDNSESLDLNGHTANAVISNNPFGRQVVVTGDADNAIRKVQIDLVAGIGASFGYGVQAGTGGFILGSNATVEGNVYANGTIVGSNGAAITGSAFAANSAAIVADQSNTSPSTP